jgi:hypothetical protein
MPDSRQVSICLAPFGDLYAALPQEWQTETIRDSLLAAYRYELHCLIGAAVHPDCQEPRLVMRPWRQAGEQYICEFWVADAATGWKPSTNFHGQNTSQWRYGGAIVIQDGTVSCHH